MHDVFISYSHKDAQVADAICHHLEESGIRCWYAPRNIAPGAEWADAIIEALEECSIVVLVFTDFSNASRQVQREVDTAVTLGKTIIPFKCTQTDPTGSMRYYLSTLHWLDAVDVPLSNSINELKGRVQAILDYEAKRAATQYEEPVTLTKEEEPPATIAPARDADANDEGAGSADEETSTNDDDTGGDNGNTDIRKRLPVIAAIAAVVLACIIGITALGGSKESADTSEASAVTETTATETEATSTTDDTSESTDSSETTETESTEQSTPVVPAEGDEGAEDIYLYTIQSDNTIRLDRYFGPETAMMVLPTTVEGLPVTNVGQKCFEDCEYIEKLVLPETMEIIQYRAFAGCKNLKEMNIPASLKKILGWSFAHTGLTSITFPDTFADLDYGAFYGCNNLESVVLSPSVDYLGENTFRMCGKLKSVTIPAAEVEINANAFEAKTDVTLIGVAGSYTEKYAKGMGLKFQAI